MMAHRWGVRGSHGMDNESEGIAGLETAMAALVVALAWLALACTAVFAAEGLPTALTHGL